VVKRGVSWPTAAVLCAVVALVGLALYLDRSQVGAVVSLLGTVATAALPALVRQGGEP